MRHSNPAVASALLLLLMACHSPTSPNNSAAVSVTEHGRLSGVVTIGPNCPGPQNDSNPCPTQPSAYASRKILIYTEDRSSLRFTVDIDSQGGYVIDLAPARYAVELKPVGTDRTQDLPQIVDIKTNGITKLDIHIDTGIR